MESATEAANLTHPEFDSLSVGVPESIYTVSADLIPTLSRFDPYTGEHKPSLYVLNRPGFDSIEITRGNVIFHLSAKLKLDRYLENLSLPDIPLILNVLKQCGKFNPDQFLKTAVIFRADVVNNLKVSRPVEEYKSALRFLASQNFIPSAYEGGYRFTHRRNKKLRLSGYPKHHELCKAKNKHFLAALSNPAALLEAARYILRIESRFDKFEITRNYLNLPPGPPLLTSVFSSTANPNLRLFREIRGAAKKNIHLTDPKNFKNFKERKDWLSMRATVLANDYDPTRIRAELEEYSSKSNVSKLMPKYLRMAEELKAQSESQPLSHIDSLLDEIEDLLSDRGNQGVAKC